MPRVGRDILYPKPLRWSRLYERHFPQDTDPTSRHVKVFAESLRDLRSPVRAAISDWHEPDHIASSLERTVKMLWEARQEITRLKTKYES